MKKPSESVSIALACAVIGVAISALAVLSITSLKELNSSVLVRMSPVEPMADLARSIEEDFQFVSEEGHYDGVYFYAIAIDPFATKEAHDLIDLSPARYSHAGYGWAAWVFSLGHPGWVPQALLMVSLLSIGGASAIASIISERIGSTPWGGLFVALNPGLVYSVSADTSEPFAALLLGLLLLAWRAERWVYVAILAVAIALTKEIFLIVLGAMFAWRLLKVIREPGAGRVVAPLAALTMGPVVWVMWQIYLYLQFDVFALSITPKLVYLPLQGWAEAMTIASGLSLSTADSQQVGQISVPLLAASAGLLAVGIYKARRLRSLFDMVYLFVAVFTFCYGPLQLVYPKDWLRLGSTAFILLPAVLFGRADDFDAGVAETHKYPERMSARTEKRKSGSRTDRG